MPRYEYECKKCFYRFTTWHSIKDRLSDCPECDEKKILRKIIGIPITIKADSAGGLFGFLGIHFDKWKSLEGFVLLPEIRQGMLAILGFYFGSSQVTVRR